MNITSFIIQFGFYISINLLSFINILLIKRNIILLLENNNTKLIKLTKGLEERLTKLEEKKEYKRKIEEDKAIQLELLQMGNEDKDIIVAEVVAEAEKIVINENDIIDLSKEMYPIANQNKKSWFKTLLFL